MRSRRCPSATARSTTPTAAPSGAGGHGRRPGGRPSDNPAVPRKPRRKGGTLKDGERRQLARASRHADDPRALPAPPGRALLLCDGGSRGNPGTAAAAAVLLARDGAQVASRAELIGHASAAEAEYRAILIGLELARAHDEDPL